MGPSGMRRAPSPVTLLSQVRVEGSRARSASSRPGAARCARRAAPPPRARARRRAPAPSAPSRRRAARAFRDERRMSFLLPPSLPRFPTVSRARSRSRSRSLGSRCAAVPAEAPARFSQAALGHSEGDSARGGDGRRAARVGALPLHARDRRRRRARRGARAPPARGRRRAAGAGDALAHAVARARAAAAAPPAPQPPPVS